MQSRAILAVLVIVITIQFLEHKHLLENSFSNSNEIEESPVSRDVLNSLGIPRGEARALPSIRVDDDNRDHGIYGGKGDKKHLGGFTDYDGAGVSPAVWSSMISDIGVHSLLDVGCGKGVSSRWFLEHGVDVLCAEGSHDAVEQSFLPPERIVEHDYSQGPWWPQKTYDAVWSVEFLEHVSRQYQYNYISTFRKAALIFVTSSTWGGWHHVEVHPHEWWVRKFESFGFKYDDDLTNVMKNHAKGERGTGEGPNGESFSAQHIFMSLKVFINPAVASLPEHAHLFPRNGCFERYGEKGEFAVTRPCTKENETPLPKELEPLEISPEMHERWLQAIRDRLQPEEANEKKE